MSTNKITNEVKIPSDFALPLAQIAQDEVFKNLVITLGEPATPILIERASTEETDTDASGTTFADRSGLVLWTFSLCYYACLDISIVYYAPKKFCAEAELSIGGQSLGLGDSCVTQNSSGSFTLTGSDKIKVAGRTVAKAEYSMTFRVDYNSGDVVIEGYYFKVCGANGFQLKCQEWSA